jgi:predicted peptidase
MKLKGLLFTLALVVVAQTAYNQAENQKVIPEWVKLYEPAMYNDVPYRLMKPIDFDPGISYPVIVSLHGGGGRGTDNYRQLRGWNGALAEEQIRRNYPCYVLAPQTTELWDGEDLSNIKAIVKTLPMVDSNRIYVLGHSMGGHGINIILQIDPHYFAAAAPSAGSGLEETEEFIDASKIKDIPIWAFHGDQDKTAPIERNQKLFAEMQKIGGYMKFTTWVGDGHGVAVKMITGADNGVTRMSGNHCDPEPVFMKWLFAQKRISPWVRVHEPGIYKDMSYRLVKPINFDPAKSYPVIVSLHGGAGRGTDNRKQLRDWNYVLVNKQRRIDYPAYILAPQSQGRWDTTHLEKIKDIINDLPGADKNRIYVLGHSMGAAGTYTFIQADPDYFAAAAPSAGRGGEVDASVIKDLPIWVFHGDLDSTVPIEGNQKLFAEMQKIGGNMKFTTWVGDGHSRVAYKMITGSKNGSTQLSSDRCDPETVFMKWLFKQKLSPAINWLF